MLELIRDSWRELGIRLFTRPMQLTLFRRRVFAGETLMSLDKGIENGLATADMSPWEFAPTAQHQLEWPKWGQFMETNGTAGERPDMPGSGPAQGALPGLARRRRMPTSTPASGTRCWRSGPTQTFTIGIIAGVQQPVVVNAKLRNVPAERHV